MGAYRFEPGAEQGPYDATSSLVWAERVAAVPRQCWWNAVAVVRRSRGRAGTYTEGFAIAAMGLVLEHGWVTAEGGSVIDPTWPAVNQPADGHYRYFPAYAWGYGDLIGVTDRHFPLYCAGGQSYVGLARGEAWRLARDAAYRVAYGKTWSELTERAGMR